MGPLAFNAEAADRGWHVTSCDPVYQFQADEIRRRIDDVYPEIMAKMRQGADSYIWESLSSVEQLGEVRMKAMSRFLSDFDAGCRQGRYVSASLPSLPFTDSEFDLALCSHYLFLYSNHVDRAAHLESMRELCRVASEVRVFPVVSLDGEVSKHLDQVMTALSVNGIDVPLQPVSYRFQKRCFRNVGGEVCITMSGTATSTTLRLRLDFVAAHAGGVMHHEEGRSSCQLRCQ